MVQSSTLEELKDIKLTLEDLQWANKKEMAYVLGHLKRLIKRIGRENGKVRVK